MAGDETEFQSSLPSDLFERGDPAFVDAIRAVSDADALAGFAVTWYNDRRPDSRRWMLEYLNRPMNAFRHEGLVKRLFKRAEAENDDEIMAGFLVLFDRSIRRARRKRDRPLHTTVATPEEAREVVSLWERLGYSSVSSSGFRGDFHVHGIRSEEVIVPPRRSTMPRHRLLGRIDPRELPAVLEKLKRFRLFSVATRNYLRRRAWRYFRKLGKAHPDRYVAAVSRALALYRDEDVVDGLSLIDNWGLVHILFHHCPAIEARPGGWSIKGGRSLAELAPSPIFEPLWKESPGAVLGLLDGARSRTVRRWAIRRVEADPALHRPALPLSGWIGLLGHDDPEVVALAAEMLDGLEGLDALGVDQWLALAESTHPVALEAVCELVGRHVRPEEVTLDQATRLAGLRALPVARLGLSWLKGKDVRSADDFRTVLGLVEADCEPLRPEILRWLKATLAGSPELDPSMVLEFLDSRHLDVRAEGWAWFRSEPRAFDDVETWRKLLESPHDDIRLALVAELESRATVGDPSRIGRSLDPEGLRALWASVLLNVHRGGRAKPDVVRQLLRRLEASPGDAPDLLPLLGVALRSIRGPERRAGLVAVVRLVEARSEVEPLVRSAFPELQLH
jgi:hypothetical protein